MSGSIADNPYRASGVIAAAAAGGGVSWQSVVTASTFTAEAGNGYPVNTTSNACTVTLPAAASVGDEIIFTDYARNFATNALTINPNSLNYQGNTTPQPVYDTAGESIHIVYMDVTKGWVPTYDGAVANETLQTYDAEYLVVAGGGSGGKANAGAGGAGGLLTNFGGTAITLSGGSTYTVTVGTGGVAVSGAATGDDGVNSVLSGTGITTITSIGGGGGGSDGGPQHGGRDGGSGGGSDYNDGGAGSGTSPQGYDGGNSNTPGPRHGASGGGGAGAVGGSGSGSAGGVGGVGLSNSTTGSAVFYAGGGGGSAASSGAGAGGNGGGGAGGSAGAGTDGTDGLGGGGGGVDGGSPSGAGGDGVVILRMADGDAGTPTNEDSVATDVGGTGETVITWLVTGSYVA